MKIRNYGTNGNNYFIDECYRMEPLIKDKIEESERYSSCIVKCIFNVFKKYISVWSVLSLANFVG